MKFNANKIRFFKKSISIHLFGKLRSLGFICIMDDTKQNYAYTTNDCWIRDKELRVDAS